MGKTRLLIAALGLVLAQTASAMAADLGLPPPPPVASPVAAPAKPCCVQDRGWYFLGYIGTTNYNLGNVDNAAFHTGVPFTHYYDAFESSGFGGIGIGYRLTKHIRFDSTWELRGKSTYHGLDSYNGGSFSGTDQYTATYKSWDWMTSLYWDVFCWNGFTPYVGAGIGYARNYIGAYSDINTPNLGVAYANSHAEGSFAWALHAGVAYQVNDRVTLDLAYRYINLGDAISGTIRAYDGSGTADGLQFNNIHSNDLMLKVRWNFGCCQAAPMPMVALK